VVELLNGSLGFGAASAMFFAAPKIFCRALMYGYIREYRSRIRRANSAAMTRNFKTISA